MPINQDCTINAAHGCRVSVSAYVAKVATETPASQSSSFRCSSEIDHGSARPTRLVFVQRWPKTVLALLVCYSRGRLACREYCQNCVCINIRLLHLYTFCHTQSYEIFYGPNRRLSRHGIWSIHNIDSGDGVVITK